MYKNLKIGLGEMSFLKDFVADTRNNLYPLTEKSDDLCERIENNLYKVEKGKAKRMFCQFFPFATYELTALTSDGKVGFCFEIVGAKARVFTNGETLFYSCGEKTETVKLPDFAKKETTLIVSCRPGAFDIYLKNGGSIQFLHTFLEDAFKNSNNHQLFKDGYVSLLTEGKVTVSGVQSYVDNGVSIADMRFIKYENGEIICEQGKVYFTASIRMQEGVFQGVFSWVPGTTHFELTGALFYDCGDGFWRGYVAPVILYCRKENKWYLWASSFGDEHILVHSRFEGDVRFGVNVVDVQFMEKATKDSSLNDFVGFKGDEDPDLFYDEENDRWLLAICRVDTSVMQYRYFFYESKEPFANFKYLGKGYDGSETGGSFVKVENELFFLCGYGQTYDSKYRIYGKDFVKDAKFNFADGGMRGWGSVAPIKTGSRTRYYWLTFDRHNGSDYNWSYGNIYCFEA